MNLTRQQLAILGGLLLVGYLVFCGFGYMIGRGTAPAQAPAPPQPAHVEMTTPAPTTTQPPMPGPTDTSPPAEYYSEEEILQARKEFKVEVLDFNAKDGFGTEFPLSDYVRLRITNNSNMILPHLTLLTKRFNAQGEMIGSSRAPSIPTSNIKPGESFEYDYYPKGHLPSVVNITVEIEHVINSDSKKFFPELNQKMPKPAAR